MSDAFRIGAFVSFVLLFFFYIGQTKEAFRLANLVQAKEKQLEMVLSDWNCLKSKKECREHVPSCIRETGKKVLKISNENTEEGY